MEIVIAAGLSCEMIAVLTHSFIPEILMYLCLIPIFRDPYTSQLAELRELYLHSDKIMETEEETSKLLIEQERNKYNKYLQSSE